MTIPTILWVDLRGNKHSETLLSSYQQHFEVRIVGLSDTSLLTETLSPPDAICFEFDCPDRAGLELLQQIRQRKPDLPVLMISEQHSEQLLLWALRLRLWDCVLKPIPANELEQQLRSQRISLASQVPWQHPGLTQLSPPRLPVESRYYNSQNMPGLRPAEQYIKQNLSEKISEETVAELCDMTTSQFSRNFKKSFGSTFQDYVQRARVEEARRLLKNPNMPILEVAMSVGFKDQSYFSRVFKKLTGMNPGTYRKQHQPEESSL